MIETTRLILRRFTLDDAAAFFPLASIPEVIRYVGNTPLRSIDEAREALASGPIQDYSTHGFGRFACVWKDTGEVIGFSGLKFIAELNDVELGYRFLPRFWGHGLATESARASIDFARDDLGIQKLIGLVHPQNLASANVMKKMGFVGIGTTQLDFIRDTHLDLFERNL